MSYKLDVSDRFERELKKLLKKFPSLKKEYAALVTQIERNPFLGTSIGMDCYKIRLAIASKGKGKSGGARVITHIFVSGKTVYLLSIYDKSERDTITDKQLKELLAQL